MPVIIDHVVSGQPGSKVFLGSVAEDGRAAVVFEDDGETAYFYACAGANGPILETLHIYDVRHVVDRDRPSQYEIGWSPIGRHAVLIINGRPHAVFDFERRLGWCRSGSRPPSRNGDWSPDGHSWDEACLAPFR
jgi:hypothetical protein